MEHLSCSSFYRNQTAPVANESAITCAASNRTSRERDLTFLLVGVPLPILSVIVNASVLLAASLQRKTLRRHNYVFSSVCSTLLSNMLYAILSVWTAIANYLRFMEQGVTQKHAAGREVSEKWWIIRNSTIICLLLAMCGNLGSLVFVLKDSTYFVRRIIDNDTIHAATPTDKRRSSWCQLSKRGKAHLLIAISWLCPALLVLTSSFTDWNCVKCCCPPGYYNGDSCSVESGCSRFWPPLAQSFLGLFLGLWLLEVILLACLLTHTSLKFQQAMKGRSATMSEMDSGINVENSQDTGNVKATSQSQRRRQSLTFPGPGPTGHHPNQAASQTLDGARGYKPPLASDATTKDQQKRRSISLNFARKFNSKMKNMMSLAAVFFLFTLPVVLGVIVDISTGNPMPGKHGFIVVGELSTFIYTLVCPIILLKFMPRLKLSVVMCWYECGRLCK